MHQGSCSLAHKELSPALQLTYNLYNLNHTFWGVTLFTLIWKQEKKDTWFIPLYWNFSTWLQSKCSKLEYYTILDLTTTEYHDVFTNWQVLDQVIIVVIWWTKVIASYSMIYKKRLNVFFPWANTDSNFKLNIHPQKITKLSEY